jgi:hypothetical protein
MNTYTNYFTISQTYAHLWSKYRPAILKLMIASADAPQQYKFTANEIKTANPKEKGGYTFTLTVHKSKSVNDIRSSVIAKDFLAILQQSRKASELSETSTYVFKLDKHFVLHVTKTELQEEIVGNDVIAEEIV